VLQGWTIAPFAKWLGIELPSSSMEPEHLSFPIPSEHGKALHLFNVIPDCKAMGLKADELPLSEGAQLAGIVRRGVFITPIKSESLLSGDHVMILAGDSSGAFGALFSHKAPTENQEAMTFFGEFVISPHATLKDLSQVYGFDVPADHEQYSVADYLNKKFYSKPVVGDQVTLGQVQFVVRKVQGEQILLVGLKLIKLKK